MGAIQVLTATESWDAEDHGASAWDPDTHVRHPEILAPDFSLSWL